MWSVSVRSYHIFRENQISYQRFRAFTCTKWIKSRPLLHGEVVYTGSLSTLLLDCAFLTSQVTTEVCHTVLLGRRMHTTRTWIKPWAQNMMLWGLLHKQQWMRWTVWTTPAWGWFINYVLANINTLAWSQSMVSAQPNVYGHIHFSGLWNILIILTQQIRNSFQIHMSHCLHFIQVKTTWNCLLRFWDTQR